MLTTAGANEALRLLTLADLRPTQNMLPSSTQRHPGIRPPKRLDTASALAVDASRDGRPNATLALNLSLMV